MKPTRTRIMAVVTVVAALLAASLLAAGQASANGGGTGGGERDPADLPAACFAAGIDSLISDFDAGLELWEGCLTDDYSFEFVFVPGGPTIACPGPDCPIQEFSSRAELRALFASAGFQGAGYSATQHQTLNVVVDRSGRTATVSSYVQANHFLDDSVDIFWGTQALDAVKERGRWKISHEVVTATTPIRNFVNTPVGG